MAGCAPLGQVGEYSCPSPLVDMFLSCFCRAQPPKQLKLVVTPFKKQCSGEDHYYRRCPSSTGQCIKRELFCDGMINCGGVEKDEQEEYCLQHLGAGLDMFMTIPIIILIVVFSIVGKSPRILKAN